ncbi:Sortase family protein [Klenkia soli]|uniref:Sortase family protein n=1 Tax=Klenkia soli TaxID=1052260 RepID=A0A1H0TRH3_9ACTN|nr:class F sortase [Klenkia soli]SDP56461.1 Sortase family protein [Klenkia soli]
MIRPTRGTAAAACLCAAAAALVAAAAGLGLTPAVPPDISPPAAETVSTGTSPQVGVGPGSGGAPPSATAPVWLPEDGTLVAEEHGLQAPVDQVQLTGQDLHVPEDPRRVGWWTGSAVPGSTHGTVVVDGHVNFDGVTGALAVLPDMSPGDHVELRSGTAVIGYTVQSVRTYRKDDGLPADLFTTDGPPRLALITCGGRYDPERHGYEDNVVAIAVPA